MLCICLDKLWKTTPGFHLLGLRMFVYLREFILHVSSSKKQYTRLAFHTTVGAVFGENISFADLTSMFGFSIPGGNSVLPKLKKLRAEILKGDRFSFRRENLYENSGHYDERIDDMIREFWLSDEASVDSDGLKRPWTDPTTGERTMKVVRVVLFPTRLEAREKFNELYGEKCTAITKANGHRKRFVPSADYVWGLKPSYVMYHFLLKVFLSVFNI